MHDNHSRRRGLFRLGRRPAASWSERASNEASSALASAPGVAEEEVGRQRAPELGNGIAAPDAAPIADSTSASAPDEPPVDAPAIIEKPSWREPDAPALPALLNRKRTTEKRDRDKTIRFTPTAVRIIAEEAERRGQKFAGFVGDAALAVALGKAGLVGSPEDDPDRPLIEAIEAHTTALNRVGNNLNQITEAIHRGAVPEQAEAVLAGVARTVESSYRLIDRLLTEGTADGA